MDYKNAELSKVLRDLRESKGLSLRQVEKKTGVSNAYLSQLENGKIGEPSPHVLHSLAGAYEISYSDLMKIAGYIQPQSDEKVKQKVMSDVAFSTLRDLTPEEQDAVLDYIKYLRSKRRKE